MVGYLEPTDYNKAHDEVNDAARHLVTHYVGDYVGTEFEERSIEIAREQLHKIADTFLDINVRLLRESRQIGGGQ